MATTSTKKGSQYEREVRDILLRYQWKVEGQHRQIMYIRDKYTGQMKMLMKGRDIFGVDLIAKKQSHKTRWIQVSTVPQKSVKEKQVKEFPWTLDHEDVELWLRVHGKKMFRVFKMTKEKTFVEVESQYVKGEENEIEYPDGL